MTLTANDASSGIDVSPHRCDTGWFDRSVCPEPCGYMHSYCAECGKRAEPCPHDTSVRFGHAHGDHDPLPYDGYNANLAHLCQICGQPVTSVITPEGVTDA